MRPPGGYCLRRRPPGGTIAAVRLPARLPQPGSAMLHLTAVAVCLLLPAADAPVAADVVIKNATLYDGTGQPPVKGDLAIKGERIVAVGTFAVQGKPAEIDAAGLVVAPGFIDLHTHSDY